jgi:hypothetical protein
VPYPIKPKSSAGFGSFSVFAANSQEALDAAKGMIERGIPEVEILDEDGRACDLPGLECIVGKAEA